MDNKILDKLKNGSFSGFDKDHAGYRERVFLTYMLSIEKKFCNMFSFTGDDDFTDIKQKLFFRHLFRHGYAGIINNEKLIEGKLKIDIMDVIKGSNVDNKKIKEIYNSILPSHIPVNIAPKMFDINENIISGQGITSEKTILGRKTFDVNTENTAMARYSRFYWSGWLQWLNGAYDYASMRTVAKKKLSILDPKLVKNRVNNTSSASKYDAIYNIDESFLDISPSTNSMTGNNGFESVNVNDLLEIKIAKLSMDNGETLNDLMEYMKSSQANLNKIFGIRTNTSDKSERNITDEFKSEEVNFQVMERDFEVELADFIKNYENVFGKKLTLVNHTKEILDSIQEQERALSGGGADREVNDKKEDKDE